MVRAERAGDDIGAGMRELYELAHRTGLVPAGPPSTTYHGEFGPGHTTEADFGLPVTAGLVDGTIEQVTVRRTGPVRFAYTTHYGGYEHIGTAYQDLYEWLDTSQLHACGPPTEIYLVAPDDAVRPKDLVTEIRVPVVTTPDLAIRLSSALPSAVAWVRNTLGRNGFTVPTEIDVGATLQALSEVPMQDYRILGVYNAELAHRALELDLGAGLMLLFNIVLRADGHTTIIEVVDPLRLMDSENQAALAAIALEARSRLVSVLEDVAESSRHPDRDPCT
ncbi:GyrI-like domain-containing protein [Nocardia aurea]|uniref:GyrI-like domain-containing protein n=1 Tax=Nocardia aurea TaxID=2144174 RepID=A0ABV3FSI3_9NOCA